MVYEGFSYTGGNRYVDSLMKSGKLYTLPICRANNIFSDDEVDVMENLLEYPKEDIICLVSGRNIQDGAFGKFSGHFTKKDKIDTIRPIGVFYLLSHSEDGKTDRALWVKSSCFLFNTAIFISWQDLNAALKEMGMNNLMSIVVE